MKSNIAGAGYGLFSTCVYHEKHLLTLMYGTLKTFAEASKESDATIPLFRGLLSWKEFVSLFQAMEGPALQTMVKICKH